MNRTIIVGALALCAGIAIGICGTLCFSSSSQEADLQAEISSEGFPGIVVISIEGMAEIRRAGEDDWTKLSAGDSLEEGDRVRTHRESWVYAGATNGNKINIGPDAILVVPGTV